jgi:hypothetical protein
MRRFVYVLCAAFAAAFVVPLSTLSAEAANCGAVRAFRRHRGSAKRSGEHGSSDGFVSQGSITETDSPEVVAARGDLAEEGRLPDYSQVVDNITKGAFRAPGWETRRGTLSHGGRFVAADAARASARFGVKIPATNDYSVYAWWPESANGGKARFGVQTAFGLKWSEVDQRADSGIWI